MTDRMTAEETAILHRVRKELAEHKRLREATMGISELTGKLEPLFCGIPYSDAISIFGCILVTDGVPYVFAENDIPADRMIWETPDKLNLLGVWHEIGEKREMRKRHQDVHMMKSHFIKGDDGKITLVTPQDKRKSKKKTKHDKRSDTLRNFAAFLIKLNFTPEILRAMWEKMETEAEDDE
jgi:hypothetical protein